MKAAMRPTETIPESNTGKIEHRATAVASDGATVAADGGTVISNAPGTISNSPRSVNIEINIFLYPHIKEEA
jgi:hypothetical protein